MLFVFIYLIVIAIDRQNMFSLELHGYTGLQFNMAISLMLLLFLLISCRKMRFCLDTISSWFIISRQQQAYYFSHNTLAYMENQLQQKNSFSPSLPSYFSILSLARLVYSCCHSPLNSHCFPRFFFF